MQRLYSMFPPGLPGLALLLLRGSVAVALPCEAYGIPGGVSSWILGATVLVSAAVCAGYLTPIVTLMALIFHGLIWFTLGVESTVVAVVFAMDAMSLALLGPGAYSVDSYRFGRRLVQLPPS